VLDRTLTRRPICMVDPQSPTPTVAQAGQLCTHPGGKWTTTAKMPGLPSTAAIGTVSTHRVNEPHRWTWGSGCNRDLSQAKARPFALKKPSPQRPQHTSRHHLPPSEFPYEASGYEVRHQHGENYTDDCGLPPAVLQSMLHTS
jgi:hypothetical protein